MSLSKIVGKAIFYAALQSAFGSVLMSSKFTIKNWVKDQETLQNAADALTDYLIIGIIWTIGTVCVMYADYGIRGAVIAFVANFIFIYWIYYIYAMAFQEAMDKHNLVAPTILY